MNEPFQNELERTFQQLVLHVVPVHKGQGLVEADDADVAELQRVWVAVERPPLQAAGEPPCELEWLVVACVCVWRMLGACVYTRALVGYVGGRTNGRESGYVWQRTEGLQVGVGVLEEEAAYADGDPAVDARVDPDAQHDNRGGDEHEEVALGAAVGLEVGLEVQRGHERAAEQRREARHGDVVKERGEPLDADDDDDRGEDGRDLRAAAGLVVDAGAGEAGCGCGGEIKDWGRWWWRGGWMCMGCGRPEWPGLTDGREAAEAAADEVAEAQRAQLLVDIDLCVVCTMVLSWVSCNHNGSYKATLWALSFVPRSGPCWRTASARCSSGGS